MSQCGKVGLFPVKNGHFLSQIRLTFVPCPSVPGKIFRTADWKMRPHGDEGTHSPPVVFPPVVLRFESCVLSPAFRGSIDGGRRAPVATARGSDLCPDIFEFSKIRGYPA